MIFPRLDPPRCILLSCALIFLPSLQNALRYIRNSFNFSRSMWWRLRCIVSTIPSALVFTILFSGAYLWCLPNGSSIQSFGFVLPISFFFSAIGYWESWIDKGHSNGIFQEVYQVGFIQTISKI